MNKRTVFYHGLLKRFFKMFQSVVYQGVPISKYIYYDLLAYCGDLWFSRHPEYVQEILQNEPVVKPDIYGWTDEPYVYDAHPDGVILMRGGFGDIAALFLPKERFFLLSPGQAEVDLIKRNRPDLTSHNFQSYYRPNPAAALALTQQITQIVMGRRDDPMLGSAEFLQWFQGKLSDIVTVLDAAQTLFQRLNVGAVLTISSIYSMDGALNLVARANRVPSLTLQHGVISAADLFTHVPILATKKLVWGNAMVKWYQKCGYPQERIAAVGSPRFDIVFNRQWCGREKLRQTLGIDSSQKVMVFAAQIYHYNQTILPIVLEALQSIPDLFLVVLLHPGDDPIPHEKLTAGYPNCKVVRFGQISLYDALSGADLFATYYSTAALEAMFFNLPIITVEPSPPRFSFGAAGASITVTNSTELFKVVARLLADPVYRQRAVAKYQNFLAQYCIPDGCASKRLFDEVEQLCRQGGTV